MVYASAKTSEIRISKDIVLKKIEDACYIHATRYSITQFGRFSSNGLVFVRNGRVLLIDTPNENAQTKFLYNFLKDSVHAVIKKIIVGHSHSDCMGGLGYLHKMNVESVSGVKTIQRIICPYPDMKYVVPGHGNHGDSSLLRHTIELAKKQQASYE
jgi:metallo-beta-lactamase class B